MDSVGATARTPRQSARSPLGVGGSRTYESIPDDLLTRVYVADNKPRSHVRTSGHHGDTNVDAPHTTRLMAPRDEGIHAGGGGSLTPVHTYQRHRQDSINSFLSKYVDVVENLTAPLQKQESKSEKIAKVVMYGVLNTVIVIPIMISFAQIIFRDPVFQPYMSELIRLVLTSAAIHQMVFTASSTLTFAIGQVQDAGLIFLSAMASSTVLLLQNKNPHVTMEELLSSTLFTLAISTALLGTALIITGKLKVASFVQYLPMPVVGGYLAYIGFYCLEAGLSMMSGKSIKEPQDWLLLWETQSLVLVLPGVFAGIVVFHVLSRCNHVAVLPCSLLVILAVFFAVLGLSGHSLEDARQAGWVAMPPATQKSIFEVYRYFDLQQADLSFVTSQIPTWIAMYFVVAFSSSLDVAAIEMALGASLDHNHELQTVGWSNLVSGLTGGFTGSYIFSQTIFTLRAQLDSRVVGLLVFLLEVVMVLCPFSVIAYVPKMFFGALQTLIAADLMMEWMWHARHKMLASEYAIVWLTFLMMNVFNLEVGIILGITIAAFNFIYSYVTVSSVRRVMKASRVERELHERALLQRARLAIVALELDGFIFFGSSVKMMKEVRKHVLIPTSSDSVAVQAALDPSNTITSTNNMVWSRVPSVQTPHHYHPSPINESTPLAQAAASNSQHQALSINADGDELCTLDEASTFIPIHNSKRRDSMLHAVRTRFFIWDFTKVRGVDATAVRSCFHATKQLLAQHGIEMMFANVPPDVERLLRVHQVIEDPDQHDEMNTGSLVFDTLDRALEWCEDELLVAEGMLPASDAMTHWDDEPCPIQVLDELLPSPSGRQGIDGGSSSSGSSSDELDQNESPTAASQLLLSKPVAKSKNRSYNESDITPKVSPSMLTREMADMYIQTICRQQGEYVYRAGEPVGGVYFIGSGKIDVYLPSNVHECMGPGFVGKKRVLRVSKGGIVGAAEMTLHHQHQFTAEARAKSYLFFLSKTKYRQMQKDHPQLAARFQQAMVQTLARTVMEFNFNE